MRSALLLAVLASPAGAFEPKAMERLSGAAAEFRKSVERPAARPSARPASHNEVELPSCREASEVSWDPDPAMSTFIGFRYVRTDGTTCAARPSDKIHFLRPRHKILSFKPGAEGETPRFEYPLETDEYVIRRNFWMRDGFSGTRSFIYKDAGRDTGRKVPETVELEFLNRAEWPLLPWEPAETFDLDWGIAEGAKLVPESSSYEYDIRTYADRSGGRLVTRFAARALRKKQLTAPDWKGVGVRLVSNQGLWAVITDAYAKYYQGEKIVVSLQVFRYRAIIDDKLAIQVEMTLDPAAEHKLDPRDPRFHPSIYEPLEAGKEYYTVWKFKRADSRFSSGEWSPETKTEKIPL